MQNKKIVATVFLVIFIIALGLFLRIYNIEHAPPGIYPDEAVNAEDALRANATGQYRWFYPANQGREGLFINIQAFSLLFFGANILALKLPSIFFGTLTVFGVFLLARELFGVRTGIFSAFLVSVGYWAVNFSRIGFRANMLPFVLVFSFYFLWKGLRTKKWLDFAVGGFIFGLGLHTYIAFRIAPAILIATLIFLLISRQNFLKEYWKKILVFLLFVFIAAIPMLYTFFIAHPEYMESRSTSISIMSPEVNKGDLFGTFLKSFILSLIKYNFWGDQNWRHNYPPYPILDFSTGTAFFFGILYSFLHFFRLLYLRIFKKIRDFRLEIHAFLLSWFFIMLAPEFLTAEGNPHALRSIGTLPVVFIFSGLTFDYMLRFFSNHNYFYRKIIMALLIGIFIFIGIFNTVKYFYFWANKPIVASSFNKNLTDISRYLQTLPPDKYTYVITSYNTLEKLPILVFNAERKNTKYLFTNQIDQIQPGNNPFVIIMTSKHEDALAAIQTRYPNLHLEQINSPLGSTYYILK
jgi:4-amino-4-deoxy-L-arabinose transferase-like glycosyltransferase